MKLSVVILNYNVRYFLEQCIKSVQLSLKGIESEIIIIDNNSTDGSCAMVKEKFPGLTLIENKENVGFSKANNQAVAQAKGEYLCILNPDTAVSEHTFKACLNFYEGKENMGALGVYLMDGTGNFLPESKRNLPTPKASLLKLMGIGRNYYAKKVAAQAIGEVAVLVGAFMFLKRTVYQEVGGFDEDYFMYGEDIDFSYKITKAGYKNYYMGNTTVLHYKGESTQKDAAYLERFYGAMRIFYKKHFQTNLILDTSVNLGVAAAKRLRKNSENKPRQPLATPKQAFLLTENFTLLKKLSENLEIPIKSASKAIFQDALHDETLFVFDASYMPYNQIFSVMKQLRNRKNQFRIYPPQSNFILGSDQSDEKGTVVVF